jgi:predicted RNase H-like nuclease (RuvC/YqgF family)
MDVVVKLANGAYMSVEIQKIGYDFPGERTACYASDLILRQYNLQKSELGDDFSYDKIHPVYVIVLIENSGSEMKAAAPHYIHRRIVSYDSGVRIAELSNICYISLDTFRNRGQNKIEKPLDAWLTFLSEYEASAVISLINQCPEFLDIYQEIAAFRKHPGELINMYSEALAIMDHNMEVMMVERARAELNEALAQLDDTRTQLDDAHSQLDDTRTQLDEVRKQNAAKDASLAAKDSEIAGLKAQLAAMQCHS